MKDLSNDIGRIADTCLGSRYIASKAYRRYLIMAFASLGELEKDLLLKMNGLKVVLKLFVSFLLSFIEIVHV